MRGQPDVLIEIAADEGSDARVGVALQKAHDAAMRAAVLDRYGPPDVLRVEEVERPVPGPAEVLVRVCAATVNRNDCAWRRGSPLVQRAISGLRRPKARILGNEFAGTVSAVGTGVSRFSIGDEVFGVRAYLSDGFGAQAEELAVRETSGIALKPSTVTFEEAAAACDAALSALPFLRKAGVGRGSSVLVYGASGAIGSAAVQLARHLGAEVTAYAGARNLDLVHSLGAAEVFDYKTHDPADTARRYDFILDAVGKLSFLRMRPALTPRGVFGSSGGLVNFAMVPITARTTGRRAIFAGPAFSQSNVAFLADLMKSGAFRPVIDRVFPLDQVVEANRYVETERKTGNVVLML
jgi:NADPH:quinone reductase-like Zn-dependent oxidoreductase